MMGFDEERVRKHEATKSRAARPRGTSLKGEVTPGIRAARQPRYKNHMKMPKHLHEKIADF